jgi:hypothetical protein
MVFHEFLEPFEELVMYNNKQAIYSAIFNSVVRPEALAASLSLIVEGTPQSGLSDLFLRVLLFSAEFQSTFNVVSEVRIVLDDDPVVVSGIMLRELLERHTQNSIAVDKLRPGGTGELTAREWSGLAEGARVFFVADDGACRFLSGAEITKCLQFIEKTQKYLRADFLPNSEDLALLKEMVLVVASKRDTLEKQQAEAANQEDVDFESILPEVRLLAQFCAVAEEYEGLRLPFNPVEIRGILNAFLKEAKCFAPTLDC